jgi:hypothetical protein
LLTTIASGAIAACGYLLGTVATGGSAVFAASLAVGLTLVVTFVAASVALRPRNPRGSSPRGVAVIACALAVTALVTAGAGALRPAG